MVEIFFREIQISQPKINLRLIKSQGAQGTSNLKESRTTEKYKHQMTTELE